MGLNRTLADNRRRNMQGGPSGFVSGDPYDVNYDGETAIEEESKGFSDTNDERGDQYLGVSEMDWADVGEMIGTDSAPAQQMRRPPLNPRDNEIPSYTSHQKASAKDTVVTDSESEPMDSYDFQDLPITVENKEGTVRTWKDKQGKSGETEMLYDYGFIDGYHGVDGDEVDVYIGPNEDSEWAFVIHQMKTPKFEDHDEDKVMLGFDSEDDAKTAYLKHYNDPGFYGGMTAMKMDEFKKILEKNATEDEPTALTHLVGEAMKKESVTAFFDAAEKLADILDADGVGKAKVSQDGSSASTLLRGNFFDPSALHYSLNALKRIAKSPAAQAALQELISASGKGKRTSMKTANRPDNDLGDGSNSTLKSPETVSLVGNGKGFTLLKSDLPSGYQGDDKAVRIAMVAMGLEESCPKCGGKGCEECEGAESKGLTQVPQHLTSVDGTNPTTARRKTSALAEEGEPPPGAGIKCPDCGLEYPDLTNVSHWMDEDRAGEFRCPDCGDPNSEWTAGGKTFPLPVEKKRKGKTSARRKVAALEPEDDLAYAVGYLGGRRRAVAYDIASGYLYEIDADKDPKEFIDTTSSDETGGNSHVIHDESDIEALVPAIDQEEARKLLSSIKTARRKTAATVGHEDHVFKKGDKVVYTPTGRTGKVTNLDAHCASVEFDDGKNPQIRSCFTVDLAPAASKTARTKKGDLSILKQLAQQAMSGESDTEEELKEKEAFYFSEDLFGYTLSALISEADGKMRNYDNDLPEGIVRQVIRTLDDKKEKRDLSLEEESDYGILTNEEESRHAHDDDDKKEASIEEDDEDEELDAEKVAKRFDREMGLAHHEYYGTPAMHIMAEKIEADELGMDIFGEENSYDFTPGERSISSIAVQNLVEERPRLLADRSNLIMAAAKAYRKVCKPIRSKVSVEQVNLSKISAHQVDENLGIMITGMLTFQVTLASHTHRRRANVSLEMPVVNGEPVEAVTMITAGGERLPFTLEAVDKVMSVRRDAKSVSRGYHGVPQSYHFEF